MRILRRLSAVLAAALVAFVASSSSATLPTQTAILTPADTPFHSIYGPVALSGDTAAIGAGEQGAGGVVYIYQRTGQSWTPVQTLANPEAKLDFGNQVAIDGDTLAVGSELSATVYIFVRSAGVWTLQQTLTAPAGQFGDSPGGLGLALQGDTLAVGGGTASNGLSRGGEVFLFARTAGHWTPTSTLASPASPAEDHFGDNIALSGSTLAVGAAQAQVGQNNSQGAVYIYILSGPTPTLQATLTSSDGAANDGFGSVALSNDTLLVGAPGKNFPGHFSQGEAYVFVRAGTSWSQQSIFTIASNTGGDLFGSVVRISGDVGLIGAPMHWVDEAPSQGETYMVARHGTVWSMVGFTASDGRSSDEFGDSIALDGSTALIDSGGRGQFSGIDPPTFPQAYVFSIPTPTPLAATTWVSGTGDDAGPCTREAPCLTFAVAMQETEAGGEIDCLTSGDFGPLTITKSLTVSCEGATAGLMAPNGAKGIVVNVGSADMVVLKGLDLNGLHHGAAGISMVGRGALTIQNSDIHGFHVGGPGLGIDVAAASGAHVLVEDCRIRDNDHGIEIRPAAGTNSLTIDRSVVEQNLFNNLIVASGGTAVLSNSTLSGTPTALLNNGGTIVSYGNNLIRNAGTPTQTLPRQ